MTSPLGDRFKAWQDLTTQYAYWVGALERGEAGALDHLRQLGRALQAMEVSADSSVPNRGPERAVGNAAQ